MKPIRFYFLLLIAASLQSCFTVKSNENFSYQKLDKKDYLNKLQMEQPHYLIDVRTPGEYAKAHLANASNFNYFAGHFSRDVDSLDRTIPVFLYCQTCHRSPLAAKIMKKKGFKMVYDLKGGYSQIDTK